MMPRRSLAALLAAAALPARAQEAWPSRPIRAIVAFPPGSGTDSMARFYAERLGRVFGQPVTVENIAGANGTIATRAAARAAPDGYTLFFGTVSTHAANPNILREPGYDPVKDFAPVSQISVNPLALMVKADFPARTLAEFIAYAKERPGRLNYGTGNAGGLGGAFLLNSAAGIRTEQVSYRGTPGIFTDLLGGRLEFTVSDLGPAMEHLRAGTLRALAVTTAQRVEQLPNVPTMRELGLDMDYYSWNAVWMPARTPAAVLARMNREIVAIGSSEECKRFLGVLGLVSVVGSAEALAALTESELKVWERIVREAGIPRE